MSGRKVLVLNGPNLGRLGTREPSVYGTATYADLVSLCESAGKELGLDVEVRQTDHEGELIGWVHGAADARLPVSARAGAEPFRAHSVITPVADGIIAGFGFQSYALALRAVAALLEQA